MVLGPPVQSSPQGRVGEERSERSTNATETCKVDRIQVCTDQLQQFQWQAGEHRAQDGTQNKSAARKLFLQVCFFGVLFRYEFLSDRKVSSTSLPFARKTSDAVSH